MNAIRKNLAAVLALVTAAVLCFSLVARLRSRRAEQNALQAQVDDGVAAWQRIAEEKEALQETLTALESEVREAELSLSEDTERAGELTAQNAALTEENAALTEACTAAEALNDRLARINAALAERVGGNGSEETE